MDNKEKYDKVKYNKEYNTRAYDRIYVYVKRDGNEKEKIEAMAKKKGFKSVNEYIKRLIDDDMERDGGAG